MRGREQLVSQRDDEHRRLPQASVALVRQCLSDAIQELNNRIRCFDRYIAKAMVVVHGEQAEQLSQIKGVGPVTVAGLLSRGSSIVARLLLWLAWRHTTATAGRSQGNAVSGGA